MLQNDDLVFTENRLSAVEVPIVEKQNEESYLQRIKRGIWDWWVTDTTTKSTTLLPSSGKNIFLFRKNYLNENLHAGTHVGISTALAKVSERNSIRAYPSYFEICFRTISCQSGKRFESRSIQIG